MTEITLKKPLEVKVHIDENLNGTYSYQSKTYTYDSGIDKGTLTYTLALQSGTPSTFDQTFDEVLTGLTTRATIDIYLKDGNGTTIKTILGQGINIED